MIAQKTIPHLAYSTIPYLFIKIVVSLLFKESEFTNWQMELRQHRCHTCLFQNNSINLTHIESRPLAEDENKYKFLCNLEICNEDDEQRLK